MKVLDVSTQKENLAHFFISNDGDVFDTSAECEITGWAVAKIIMDGFYVGSLADMRRRALSEYQNVDPNPAGKVKTIKTYSVSHNRTVK
jgi:hypothetical protein